MNEFQLLQGDCLEVMRTMPDNRFDLTVTSPPYDHIRDYDGTYAPDSLDWRGVIKELYRVTAQGGVVVWVVADATKNGSESGTSFMQALWAKECGFNLHDTMIYQVSGTGAKGSNYAYWQAFEYMFVWSKGKPKVVNRIADVKNVHGGRREKPTPKNDRLGTRMMRNGVTLPMYSVRPNVWKYHAGTNGEPSSDHPAPFPLKLAKDHILSWSAAGDVVFDPFAGSGTTGVACMQLGRRFVGCEINPAYHAIAQRRIGDAAAQPMLFALEAG